MTAPTGAAAAGVIEGAKQVRQTVTGLLPGADAAASVIDGIVATRRWISDRHNWIRVGWFVSGAVLFYGGAYMIIRPATEPLATAAAKTATKVGAVL
jgi:type IV secretory pathway VirB2 component (pilin)